jgi:hypothetical protein
MRTSVSRRTHDRNIWTPDKSVLNKRKLRIEISEVWRPEGDIDY